MLFTDQTGRIITLNTVPQRIISLVPSQTELLCDLGMNEEVVGITKFCIHPEEWFRNKTKVGGTKQLKMDIIHELKPDLIIANKEENVKEQVEELANSFPVWVSDVANLEDAYEMIEQIGVLINKAKKSKEIVESIKKEFSLFQHNNTPSGVEGTAYLIWQKPFLTAGGDTFIHAMMEAAGLKNIFANRSRYPEITISDLLIANCQVLLLSSEPFPFKQIHIDELQPFLPNTKIVLADGEMFSWYGSRLLKAPAYFKKLRHSITG